MRWISVSAVVALGLAALAGADHANAQGWRPYDPVKWCAYYGGGDGDFNCGFLTLEQCRLAVSGTGGFCEPNPFYNPHRSKRRRPFTGPSSRATFKSGR